MTTSAGTRLGPRRLTTISLKRFSHSCWAISSLSSCEWLDFRPSVNWPITASRSFFRKARMVMYVSGRVDPLLHRVAVVLREGRLVLQLRHLRVDEDERPDGDLFLDDELGKFLQVLGVGLADGNDIELLQRLYPDRHFADEAGGAACIGDEIEIGAGKFPDLAVRHDHPGAHHVLLEPAGLEGTDAGATLGEPSAGRRRRITRGVEPQGQVLFRELPVELLPDHARLDP